MKRLAVLLAVWYAGRTLRNKRLWNRYDLCKYQDLLVAARDILKKGLDESASSSSMARWISTKLLTVLNSHIEELESLIRLNPLLLGILKKK